MHIYIHNMHKQMHTLKNIIKYLCRAFWTFPKNSLKSCTKIYAYEYMYMYMHKYA